MDGAVLLFAQLARNNAWQPTVSVPLSMRGDQDGVNPMPLSPTVDAWRKT